MKAVFGPVPSRRLGQSLGIDPVPLKTCNWNCVYCQLGRTAPLCNERQAYIPIETILEQVAARLAAAPAPKIDWITIVGSGEPTLHSGLGQLIREIKKQTSIPLAVLTNGATLYLPEVRQALAEADAVLPSLDAGNPRLYRRINRPHPDLKYPLLIEGLQAFRREYSGSIWLEVMLVAGLNDDRLAMQEIARVIETIRPDQVHINTPERPPAERWVRPPDPERIRWAHELLGENALVVSQRPEETITTSGEDLAQALLEIITRHPMQEEALVSGIRDHSPEAVRNTLRELQESGQAQIVIRYGKHFFASSGAKYVHEDRIPDDRPDPLSF